MKDAPPLPPRPIGSTPLIFTPLRVLMVEDRFPLGDFLLSGLRLSGNKLVALFTSNAEPALDERARVSGVSKVALLLGRETSGGGEPSLTCGSGAEGSAENRENTCSLYLNKSLMNKRGCLSL